MVVLIFSHPLYLFAEGNKVKGWLSLDSVELSRSAQLDDTYRSNLYIYSMDVNLKFATARTLSNYTLKRTINLNANTLVCGGTKE